MQKGVKRSNVLRHGKKCLDIVRYVRQDVSARLP
jgi:hypothetical protein